MRKLARNCLYPAQHSIQHINKKLLRSQIRERCLRQTIKRESAEEECDERVPLRESVCKGRSKQPYKGDRTLSSPLPFGRKRPGGEFWEPFWHLFSDVFEYRFCIDFSLTFYRFSVLLNLAKSDFYVGSFKINQTLMNFNINFNIIPHHFCVGSLDF